MLYIKNTIKKIILNKSYTIPDNIYYSSIPYISGDGFRGLANYVIDNYGLHEVYYSNKFKIFYVDVINIENVIKKINLISGNILIIHNGDSTPSNDLRKIFHLNNVKLYCTNIKPFYPNEVCIPIGLENARLKRSGSMKYYYNNQLNHIYKNNLLLASFNIYTNINERKPLYELCKKIGINFHYDREILTYKKKLSESKFVLSPSGNGVDCHRTWEAIYHKTIPVILNKNNLFKNLMLPILSVNSYEDFLFLSDEEKNIIYNRLITIDPFMCYMPYWYNKILGNYE